MLQYIKVQHSGQFNEFKYTNRLTVDRLTNSQIYIRWMSESAVNISQLIGSHLHSILLNVMWQLWPMKTAQRSLWNNNHWSLAHYSVVFFFLCILCHLSSHKELQSLAAWPKNCSLRHPISSETARLGCNTDSLVLCCVQHSHRVSYLLSLQMLLPVSISLFTVQDFHTL